ncbi:hypothetical protein NLI96_g2701 [Meripilus lineatus]|uniref:Uncharacterized protein n=1 Tax=Meripilus lineatus TaxID=2056292 RepID=A0AAD5V7U3_9APHY|nr:hypothetical protein NLI96_g2701 [Physisporinus lineatus]
MSPIDLARLDSPMTIKEEPAPIDLGRPGSTMSTKKEESPADLGHGHHPIPVKMEQSSNDFSHPSPTVPTKQEPSQIDDEHQDFPTPVQKELSPVIQRNPENTGGLHRGYANNYPRRPLPFVYHLAYRRFAWDYFNATPFLSFEASDVLGFWRENRNMYMSAAWNSMHSPFAPPPGTCWIIRQTPCCGRQVIGLEWCTFPNPEPAEMMQEAMIISTLLFMESRCDFSTFGSYGTTHKRRRMKASRLLCRKRRLKVKAQRIIKS